VSPLVTLFSLREERRGNTARLAFKNLCDPPQFAVRAEGSLPPATPRALHR